MIKDGFEYACEAVFWQQVCNIYIYKKEILSLFICLLMLFYQNSWFLKPLLLLTYLFVCYISGLILIYFFFIDKRFKNKHPILFTLLVITCLLVIAFSLFNSVRFTSHIIKDIKSYLLNMNTSGDSSNNPQDPFNPSGSTGSSGGSNQPGGDGNTNIPASETQEERRRRLKRIREKRYRDNQSEQFKEQERIRFRIFYARNKERIMKNKALNKEINSLKNDLKEVEDAIFQNIISENPSTEITHLKHLQKHYSTFFDEESGNKDNSFEGFRQLDWYLREDIDSLEKSKKKKK